MKDLKIELEELFGEEIFDEEAIRLINQINAKLEEIKLNNNAIESSSKNFEKIIYNLDKLISSDLKEFINDNKKNT